MRDSRPAQDDFQVLVDAWAPVRPGTASVECAEELRRFDEDVQRHVEIENHVLFPKAIELETWDSRA